VFDERPLLLPDWMHGTSVALGVVPEILPNTTHRGALWQAGAGRILLTVPGVGRYLATDGVKLTIDPEPAADPNDVRSIALTSPLAALCLQRGMLVLHAAAVGRPAGVALLCGHSAAGKSTLAAVLAQRGWTLIADDLAPIDLAKDGVPLVHPTACQLALWPDAVKALRLGRAVGREAGEGVLKWQPESVALAPIPVSDIWCVRVHSVPEPDSHGLVGDERLASIPEMSFNRRITGALLERKRRDMIAAMLGRATRMHAVRRHRTDWSVEQLADLVEAGTTRNRIAD
jgi:hypothetical protein